jgi:hypothetical protein
VYAYVATSSSIRDVGASVPVVVALF